MTVSCALLLDNSGQFNDVDMEVVVSMLFMIPIWIHGENAFMLHALRDKAPPSPRSLAAVCSWASCFFRRYAEEHIQKTGVAIETQGFTFITSGRKRESLTVRAARDCRRARWCWLCTSFLVLLEWASFRNTPDMTNVSSFTEEGNSQSFPSTSSHNTLKYGCKIYHLSICAEVPPPCWLVILRPLQCGVAVNDATLHMKRPGRHLHLSSLFFLPPSRSAAVLLW